MADLFTNEQARRLFGLIAAGGSAGAVAGSALTAALVVRIGVTNLLLISHTACTCVILATTKPKHLADNLGAAYGHLPDAKTRRRMAEFMAQL